MQHTEHHIRFGVLDGVTVPHLELLLKELGAAVANNRDCTGRRFLVANGTQKAVIGC